MKNKAFTIVELLVVIVVIGILAAVTIVSYTGITNRANIAALQADLSNASKQLKLFYVDNGIYPGSVTDCPTPSTGNMCLKSSGGNTFSSYSANNSVNPPTFNLAASNSGNIYKVTENTQPVALGPSPLTPVADWLATMQGDHYGNFYDLAGKQYATVTRSTPKTIYDPATQKIYDVPANYLGINSRSDGKSGSEALIEESRTNYNKYSYFNTDGNADGYSDGWNQYNTVSGVVTYSRPQDAVYGTYSQRIRYSSLNDVYKEVAIQSASADTGSFAPGDTAIGSVYLKGSASGCDVRLAINAEDSASSYLAQSYSSPIAITTTWKRYTFSYSNLPASTSKARFIIMCTAIDTGDSEDIYVSSAQLEKGTFETSYIPTTTTSITRNADVVSIPTTNWNASSGTFFGIVKTNDTYSASSDNKYMLNLPGTSGNTNRISFYQDEINRRVYLEPFGLDAVNADAISGQSTYGTYYTGAGRWGATKCLAYLNGTGGTEIDTDATSAVSGTAYIGNKSNGLAAWNGLIQRIIVYSSSLSDIDIATVTNAVKDGP